MKLRKCQFIGQKLEEWGGKTYGQSLLDGSSMGGEITLVALRHTFATPSNESILGQAGVRIADLDEGELYAAIRKLVDEIYKFTFCSRLLVNETEWQTAAMWERQSSWNDAYHLCSGP